MSSSSAVRSAPAPQQPGAPQYAPTPEQCAARGREHARRGIRAGAERIAAGHRASARRGRQGRRRPGRRLHRSADHAARPRARAAGGRARRREDADGARVQPRSRPRHQARAVHARPDARRRVGLADLRRRSGEFEFREGPVFTNVLLADEINRTPPKTQSALLEAMEERQVSADGVTRALPDPFIVCATQNPIEHEGTYTLPEAQLDSFLLKLVIDLPERDAEVTVLRRHADGFRPRELDGVESVVTADEILRAQRAAAAVTVTDDVLAYVGGSRAGDEAEPVRSGRRQPSRLDRFLLAAAKAWTWLERLPRRDARSRAGDDRAGVAPPHSAAPRRGRSRGSRSTPCSTRCAEKNPRPDLRSRSCSSPDARRSSSPSASSPSCCSARSALTRSS